MAIFVWLLHIDSETQFCPTTLKRLIWVKVAIFAWYLQLTQKRSVGYDKLCKKSDFSKNELKIIFLFPTFDTIKCLTTLKDLISVKTDKKWRISPDSPNWLTNTVFATIKCQTTLNRLIWVKTDWPYNDNFRLTFRFDAERQFGLVRNV